MAALEDAVGVELGLGEGLVEAGEPAPAPPPFF